MDRDVKINIIWTTFLIIIILGVTTGIVLNSKFRRESDERMAKMGYMQVIERITTLGSQQKIWKKVLQ